MNILCRYTSRNQHNTSNPNNGWYRLFVVFPEEDLLNTSMLCSGFSTWVYPQSWGLGHVIMIESEYSISRWVNSILKRCKKHQENQGSTNKKRPLWDQTSNTRPLLAAVQQKNSWDWKQSRNEWRGQFADSHQEFSFLSWDVLGDHFPFRNDMSWELYRPCACLNLQPSFQALPGFHDERHGFQVPRQDVAMKDHGKTPKKTSRFKGV